MKHLFFVMLTGMIWTSSLGQVIHDNTSLEKKGPICSGRMPHAFSAE